MVQQLAPGDEIHEASVGDIDTVLDLQPRETGTRPRDDGEAPVGKPRAAVEHEVVEGSSSGVARQQPHDGFEREVGVNVLAGQANTGPQLRVPGEKIKSSRNSRTRHELVCVEERQDS